MATLGAGPAGRRRGAEFSLWDQPFNKEVAARLPRASRSTERVVDNESFTTVAPLCRLDMLAKPSLPALRTCSAAVVDPLVGLTYNARRAFVTRPTVATPPLPVASRQPSPTLAVGHRSAVSAG